MAANSRRLSQEQIEQIIRLRAAQVSVREVAKTVGCTTATVCKHYNTWLDEQARYRRKDLELVREERLMAHEATVALARRVAEEAADSDDPKNAAANLGVMVRANTQIDKLLGVEAALKIDATIEIAPEQARKLAAAVKAACATAGIPMEDQKKLFAALRTELSEK